MKRFVLSLLLPLVLATCCKAQIENCTSFKRSIDKIVNAKPSDDVDADAILLIDIGSKNRCFLQYISGVGSAGASPSLFNGSVKVVTVLFPITWFGHEG